MKTEAVGCISEIFCAHQGVHIDNPGWMAIRIQFQSAACKLRRTGIILRKAAVDVGQSFQKRLPDVYVVYHLDHSP
jgi:hypothetical protein